MNLTNRQILMLFGTAAVVFTGCDQRQVSQRQDEQVTLQDKVLPHPNSTNYEFDASVSEVTNAIKKAYGTDWYLAEAKKNRERVWKGGGDATTEHALTLALQSPPPSLFFKGDADALSKYILTKVGNENDAYLFGSTSPVSESQVYFKDGQPLIYYADFHIHFTELGVKKPKLKFLPANPAWSLAWIKAGRRMARHLSMSKFPRQQSNNIKYFWESASSLGRRICHHWWCRDRMHR